MWSAGGPSWISRRGFIEALEEDMAKVRLHRQIGKNMKFCFRKQIADLDMVDVNAVRALPNMGWLCWPPIAPFRVKLWP